MTSDPTAALAYAEQHRELFLEELKQFVGIPSVSTDPSAKHEVERAAAWVAGQLSELGMQNVAIYPTGGHPVVYGESLAAGPDAPTVLIYGHMDVQPAEPLELWKTPPFEATQVGENLYGRGASDMKGQVVASLKAVESLARTTGLPVNLKFLIEGEEEIGSPHLKDFILAHRSMLASDFALNTDSGFLSSETPCITYGLRGLAYFELRLSGPDHDLHSGSYGGVVHNPAQVLCELIAGMHDGDGRITLPGFYDSVRQLADEERHELARLPMDDAFFLKQTGASALYGEAGFSPVERVGARPTLEVNGLLSGFTGEGQKTVLPAHAMAKISMRLVPNQDPDEVHQQLVRYIQENVPSTVQWEVINMVGNSASISDRSSPAVKAMGKALEDTWGVRPVFKREGGSIPVVSQMQEILNIQSVIAGFGLPDDNLHAPNEKQHLPTLFRGIDALIRFLSYLD